MSHARRHGSGRGAWGALGIWIALGACGGVSAADDAPAPAPKPLEETPPASPPSVVLDTVEFLADSLVSPDPVQREMARGRLEGASLERVRAVVRELARRLVPKEETVRRATSNVAVSSSIRYVDLTCEGACGLPGFDPCATGSSLRVLDAGEVEQWLTRAKRGEGVKVITNPKVTTYDGQRSTIQVLNKKAYIADYEIEETPSGTIADPVIEQMIEGLATDLRATVSADKAFISLMMEIDLRQLVAPIAVESLTVPGSPTPVVVQRPETRGLRWSRTVTFPVGGTVLVLLPAAGGWGATQAGHVFGLMVTCTTETLDVAPGTPIVDFDGEDAFKVGPPDLPPPGASPPSPAPEGKPKVAPAPQPAR